VTRTYRGLTAEQRAAERRTRLVQAGLETFGTQGYAAATIEALCREANVTARHFYEHFTGREALLVAVYDEVLAHHRGAIAAALAEAPEDALEPRVRAAVGAAVAAWTADRGRARVAFIEVVGVSPEVEALRLRAIEEYTDLVTAVADDLLARGLSRRGGRRVASRAIVGALIGLVELWLTAAVPPRPEEMAAEATVLALAALG
jgi:AcrR family transcriptional regulator